MFNFLKRIIGSKSDKDMKELKPIADSIHVAYETIKNLSNDELRAKTIEFKNRIAEFVADEENQIKELRSKGEDPEIDIDDKEGIYLEIDKIEKLIITKVKSVLDDILPEAFSVMKEAAKRFKENDKVEVTASQHDKDLSIFRKNIEIIGDKAYYENTWNAGGTLIKWDMVHYDVQLIGGVVLHQSKIAEMATGEGKTLVATLPVYLNALSGRGVHIVTVNDYLAKRDSEWMGMLYEFLGLKVDCIDKHEPNSEARRNAYLADITYGTNNEFGFDYLRDNMARFPDELVQRKHFYAIVDEVDSVLIDDARTPLIISGPTPKGEKHQFDEYKPKIEKLYSAQRNLINNLLADAKRYIAENATPENEKKGTDALFRAFRGLPKNKALIKMLSEPGMRTLMQKTENFYLQEQQKNMHIIDDELYFVIDEKNNTTDLTEKGLDLITDSVDDSKFFVIPDLGSTIAEYENQKVPSQELEILKSELYAEFAIKSERIHTMQQLMKAYTLFDKDVDYVVMDNKVKIVDEQTGRILDGRRYSDGLHQAIEAKENVKVEAATQTYATITLQNYFRMYDKLAGMTGTAETEAGEFWEIYKLDVVVVPTNRDISRKDKEDLIYKTKREKYNAVINEIVDLVEKGRPVLVGTTSVEISELLSRMLTLRKIRHNVLNAKLHQKEADIVAEAGQLGTVTIATNMAGRGTDIKLGAGVKEAGGLAIIGTERHESRRVDRQLRGRAGRQGDPGTSQFFVSLEDDLMRLFGSERIARYMDRLGLKEGEEIQHSLITKSIERAQRKVEENNFGIRKRLLEYDDVMNYQRENIYKKRRHALFGERLSIDIADMIYNVSEKLIKEHQDITDFESFKHETIRILGTAPSFGEKEFSNGGLDKLSQELYEDASQNYKTKSTHLVELALPIIKDVYENKAGRFENISIPVTDGFKTLNVMSNLKKAYESQGKEILTDIEKGLSLAIIDDAWKEHLREMDELKQSVQNAVYEQKDPLLIYKLESRSLFDIMIEKINHEIISFLMLGKLPIQNAENLKEAKMPEKSGNVKLKTGRNEVSTTSTSGDGPQKTSPIVVEKRIGRNDPCPCGSGKKFKHCHGIDAA